MWFLAVVQLISNAVALRIVMTIFTGQTQITDKGVFGTVGDIIRKTLLFMMVES
jgi:hypothetical protein